MKLITNRKEWDELVSSLEERDIFYNYDFMDITKKKEDKLWLVYYKKGKNFVVYPFYLKKIPNQKFFDITSAEQGGPLFNSNDKEFIKEFFVKFGEFCKKKKIISEFCRLNPFNKYKKEIIKELNGDVIKNTVVADLKEDLEKNINKERRKKIRRASKKLTVKQVLDAKLFYEMYKHTMDRRNATKRFVHDLDFFEKLIKKLKNNVTIFVAYYENKPVASLLLLHDGKFVHNFLSCSYKDYLKLHVNDLLKYYGIIWAKKNKFELYNLGGGVEGNDGLYRYKLSFSPLITPRCIYKRIFNKEVYNKLVKSSKNTNFFPTYRSEND